MHKMISLKNFCKCEKIKQIYVAIFVKYQYVQFTILTEFSGLKLPIKGRRYCGKSLFESSGGSNRKHNASFVQTARTFKDTL